MGESTDDPPPALDYAGPRPRERAPASLPVARAAWRPGEENKALAEGGGAMLFLVVVMPVVAVVVAIVGITVIAAAVATFLNLAR